MLKVAIFTVATLVSCYVIEGHLCSKKPNIIVIMADDMGWNDVGFHGSSQIPTPNIDALAYNGVILDRFYTQSTCTPSRTAFMTGQYPIRSGMQGTPIKAGEDRALPADMPTIAERLRGLGYKTRLVGKWHLGASHRRNTPTQRGFDSHFGYWNGFIGYFKHFAEQPMPTKDIMQGLDFFDGFEPLWSYEGRYATDLFTEKAVEVIDKHDQKDPLFLMLAHLAPHTGTNGTELGVLNITETNIKYAYIKDPLRRRYAEVVNRLDGSVGQVMRKLSEKNMLDNSIIMFLSDNGAQTVGLYENCASSWPFRGLKFTEFEGGVRGTAAIFSPLFNKKNYINRELIHITDFLPTFYAAAGGNVNNLGDIDGINQWDVLSKDLPTKRREILVNINEVEGSSAIIFDKGRYKFVNGSFQNGVYDQYYGDDGREPETPPYNIKEILNSDTNRIIVNLTHKDLTEENILKIRQEVDVSTCRSKTDAPNFTCIETPCLFDLKKDPCETVNLFKQKPLIAKRMQLRLREYLKEIVPQKNVPSDPNANPIYYNNTWCTWLDTNVCHKTTPIIKLPQ